MTLQDQTKVVRCSGIASEEDLRKAFASTGSIGVCKVDIARFLANRELIVNFLRVLMPPGTRVRLHALRRDRSGEMLANVAYHPGWKGETYIDLESMILSHGFGMPAPRHWHALLLSEKEIDDDELPSEYFGVPYVWYARESGCGLWADGSRTRPGVTNYPWLEGCDPKFAVPLPRIFGRPNGSAAITIICKAESDVPKIAKAAPWINEMLKECFSSIKATDPSEASHLTELEHTVLSRLNAAKQWGDDPPKIERVQVRSVTIGHL